VNSSNHWTDRVAKAAMTLLLTAVAAFVGWHLMRQLLPALLVIAGLVFTYRLAIGRRNGGGW
jgi:hypothetical protein